MKLQKLQFITHLEVDHAVYELRNTQGQVVKLQVNYKDNWFELGGETADEKFIKEVKRLAAGMLVRKHATNLATKEHYLESNE